MSSIGFTLFISVFFAIGFALLGYGIYSFHASLAAGKWPTVEGTVMQCDLTESSDSDGSTYKAEVKYSYAVAGVNYEGDRIAFGYAGSSGREAQLEIVDRLQSAKTILVRYDPADASRSVLCYGMNHSTIVILIFATVWLIFMTGFSVLWKLITMSDSSILSTLITTS